MRVQVFYVLNNEWELLQSEAILMHTDWRWDVSRKVKTLISGNVKVSAPSDEKATLLYEYNRFAEFEDDN
jgi:hypothetical protein